AETLIYTFDLINNSSELSPGVTLGYDIRDYCDSPTLAMKQTYDFVQQNFILDANNANACGRNNSSTPSSAVTSPDARAPVVAVIGAYDSGTTVLIAELLQVVEIPLISPFSSSEQLNNEFYKAFFRTIPPDGQQARTISDIIEYFNWTYVAPLAVDSSYGRYGVDALIAQSQKRSTFCMRPTAFFPRSGLHNCPTLTPHVSPADLVHYIQNVSLQGMTGRVAFDAQGNPKSSAYDIISYLPDTDRAPSCSNCTGGRTPNAARTMCISEKMADNQLSSAVGVVIIVLSAVGIVTACVDLVLIIQFYRTPLIKASNRELSVVLLALIIITFVLSIIHIATPTEAICSLIHLQVTSLSYLILLTLLCVYYSFKARNLPANFNETRYIGLSLYILLLSWVTYYPINSALEGWYVSTISSMTALLSGYGLLGCIFVPKMYIIIFQPDMNTNEFV
ncbi:predicted protein, partial [Nematostella vectensis]